MLAYHYAMSSRKRRPVNVNIAESLCIWHGHIPSLANRNSGHSIRSWLFKDNLCQISISSSFPLFSNPLICQLLNRNQNDPFFDNDQQNYSYFCFCWIIFSYRHSVQHNLSPLKTIHRCIGCPGLIPNGIDNLTLKWRLGATTRVFTFHSNKNVIDKNVFFFFSFQNPMDCGFFCKIEFIAD